MTMVNAAYSHVIWDWNGTLLGDVAWNMACMNRMLIRRGMRPLAGIAEYHSVFCFPVIEYYKNVGFDFAVEPFEALAEEYTLLYNNADSGVRLYDGAEMVLREIRALGTEQIILSATAQDSLTEQVSRFGVRPLLDDVLGISDIYAAGKAHLGLDYLARVSVTRGIMVGDTAHDFEVAQAMGLDCALVAHGHQSRARLVLCGVPVFDDLTEVAKYIKGSRR